MFDFGAELVISGLGHGDAVGHRILGKKETEREGKYGYHLRGEGRRKEGDEPDQSDLEAYTMRPQLRQGTTRPCDNSATALGGSC